MAVRSNLFILLCSLLAFSLAQGFSTLNPANISWLLQGDYANHLVGWEFYRHSEWRWPLTYFDGLIYPTGATTVQMDSIPIVALVFKFLLAGYKGDFQYFGLWVLISFYLNGLFAFLIFQNLQISRLKALIGSVFFIFSPVLMWRLGHVALTAHWLILAMFYEVVKFYSTKKANAALVGAYVFIAGGIHPYLMVMVFVLAAGLWLDHFRFTNQGPRSFVTLIVTAILVPLSAVFWGYFSIQSPATTGFGDHNVDLLGALNSMGTSTFLPALRMKAGQSEGYCYLGVLGILGSFVAFRGLRKKQGLRSWLRIMPAVYGMVFLMFLFSLASPLRFGGNDILSLDVVYEFLGPLPGIFRATGRFVWPAYYGMMIVLLLYFFKKIKNLKWWGLCIFIFAVEFTPAFYGQMKDRVGGVSVNNSETMREFSELNIQGGDVVHLYPKFHEYVGEACLPKDGYTKEEFLVVALAVAKKGGRLSSGSTSRLSENIVETCRHFADILRNRKGSAEWVVIHPKHLDVVSHIGLDKAGCRLVGSYEVCRL